MRKLHAFTTRPRAEFLPIKLGWTEFGILAVLVALILLLTGFVLWQW